MTFFFENEHCDYLTVSEHLVRGNQPEVGDPVNVLSPNQDLGEYASLVTHSALQWQTHTQGLAGCLLWVQF